MTSDPRVIAGLRQIIGEFDAFLVDQFGVMHDGSRPYKGAVDALLQAKHAGKTILILTNSGKRAAPNVDRVRAIGFPDACFSGLVSSGEVAWTGIRNGTLGREFVPGARAALVGKLGEEYGFDDLGLTFVEEPGEADILLIMGSDCPRTSLEDYRRQLAPAAARSVPALCCNPDVAKLTSQGLQPSAGAIAALYIELGGTVSFVGKPHGAIYREAALKSGAAPGRILTVGDSLAHDIAGGANAGFRTALVRTGILAEIGEAAFAETLAAAPKKPDFILPRLRW